MRRPTSRAILSCCIFRVAISAPRRNRHGRRSGATSRRGCCGRRCEPGRGQRGVGTAGAASAGRRPNGPTVHPSRPDDSTSSPPPSNPLSRPRFHPQQPTIPTTQIRPEIHPQPTHFTNPRIDTQIPGIPPTHQPTKHPPPDPTNPTPQPLLATSLKRSTSSNPLIKPHASVSFHLRRNLTNTAGLVLLTLPGFRAGSGVPRISRHQLARSRAVVEA